MATNISIHQRIVTILTLIVVTLWVISFVVRRFTPWPEAALLDNLLPLVLGYWFVATAVKNGVKNGGVASSTEK